MDSGPPARESMAKRKTTATATASRKRNERAVNAMLIMVTSLWWCSSIPLRRPAEPPGRSCGNLPESGKLLRREQDAASRIDGEAAQRSTDATGQPKLARGIKKQKGSLADAIALSARPQTHPLH